MSNLWAWIQYLFGREKADEKSDASRFNSLESRVAVLEQQVRMLAGDNSALSQLNQQLKSETDSLEDSERKAV